MTDRVLILGGIREAAELAADLVSRGDDVTTSLAGRTKEPKPLAGKTRIGGFGGAEGLADYLTSEKFTRLIDCTHPFAHQISANAMKASLIADVPLEIRARPAWERQDGDEWIEVVDLAEAEQAIPRGARVLLALGSQHLELFEDREDVHFTIRMVDQPESPLAFKNHNLVLGKPSSKWEEELALLKQEQISHIVCRNSGGKGAYAKIQAARKLGLPVIIVGR